MAQFGEIDARIVGEEEGAFSVFYLLQVFEGKTEQQIYKRYSDFRTLYNELCTKFPTSVVGHLGFPGKRKMYNLFNRNATEFRRDALNNFLKQIISNQTLLNFKSTLLFLFPVDNVLQFTGPLSVNDICYYDTSDLLYYGETKVNKTRGDLTKTPDKKSSLNTFNSNNFISIDDEEDSDCSNASSSDCGKSVDSYIYLKSPKSTMKVNLENNHNVREIKFINNENDVNKEGAYKSMYGCNNNEVDVMNRKGLIKEKITSTYSSVSENDSGCSAEHSLLNSPELTHRETTKGIQSQPPSKSLEKLTNLDRIDARRSFLRTQRALSQQLEEMKISVGDMKKKHELEVKNLESLVSSLKESHTSLERQVQSLMFPVVWQMVDHCQISQCNLIFSIFNGRHHCRRCGLSVCGLHSANKAVLPGFVEPSRVCTLCYDTLLFRK